MRLGTAMDRGAVEKKAREAAIEAKKRQDAAKDDRQFKNDRQFIDTIMRHLHGAGQTLLHGKIGTAEKMKHEFNKLMHSIDAAVHKEAAFIGAGLPEGAYSVSAPPGELKLPNATSLQHWNASVEKMIPIVKQLPNATGCLPDKFKRQLADLIKQGKMLCGGTSSAVSRAGEEIGKSGHLYAKLSGTSFL